MADPEPRRPWPDQRGPLSPEAELLLCCARTRIDAHTSERIRRLAGGSLNWVEFVGLARHHGVLAIVWAALRDACPDAVPAVVGRELDRLTRKGAERSRRLAEELSRLLAMLAAHAIAAIPLKGPVLGVSVYGDLTLRESVDVDILIRPRDAARARDLFLAEGYELQTALNARGFPSGPGEYEFGFAHPGRRIQTELCWRITPEAFLASLGLDDLWERTKPVRLADSYVAHLAPEEHLLVLCVHGGKHFWLLLKWICDVAELLRAHPGLEWDRLGKLAARLGCRRAVALGLLLAYEVLDAPLPEAVVSKIRTQAATQRLACRIRGQLFTAVYGSADAAASWSSDWGWGYRRYFFDLVERGADKIWSGLLMFRAGLHMLVPTDKDRRVLPLPAALAFLYYAIRPVRAVLHYILQPAAKHLGATIKGIRPAAIRPD